MISVISQVMVEAVESKYPSWIVYITKDNKDVFMTWDRWGLTRWSEKSWGIMPEDEAKLEAKIYNATAISCEDYVNNNNRS